MAVVLSVLIFFPTNKKHLNILYMCVYRLIYVQCLIISMFSISGLFFLGAETTFKFNIRQRRMCTTPTRWRNQNLMEIEMQC